MAASHSPSSSHEPPYAIVAAPPKATSRRLPPPCWSHNEIVALIDVYREKWYSLRRGNLRAGDWQEVAAGVAGRCLFSDSPKTSIQCRHKMEKLRKRYRAEIQRIGNVRRGNRYLSSWIHFKLMESMELGTSSDDLMDKELEAYENEENEDDLLLNPNPNGINQAIASRITPAGAGNRNNRINRNDRIGNGNGVRIRIPNLQPMRSPPGGVYSSNKRPFDDLPPLLPVNSQYGSGSGNGIRRRKEGNAMDEMVAAIERLGDGFVKMERMKMDMARELESMRMKMEIKQTEMVLEMQQKIWDSLSETVLGKKNKKMKRMATAES